MTQSLFITLNERCTRSCSFCFMNQGVGTWSSRVLDLEVLRQFLAEHPARFNSFFLTGGEPFLNENFFEILQFLSSQGEVYLLTNGDRIEKEMMNRLRPLRQVILSIKGSSYEELQKTRQLLDWFHESDIPVSGISVITRQTWNELPKLFTLMEETNTPLLVQPAYLSPQAPTYDTDSFHGMSNDEWSALDKLMEDYFIIGGNPSFYLFWRLFYHKKHIIPPFCGMDRQCHVLDPSGVLHACFHSQASHSPFPNCFGEHCLSMFSWI